MKHSHVITGLGAAVLVLLVALAYLLGRGSRNNGRQTVEFEFASTQSQSLRLHSTASAVRSNVSGEIIASRVHSGVASTIRHHTPENATGISDGKEIESASRTSPQPLDGGVVAPSVTVARLHSYPLPRLPFGVCIYGTSSIHDWTASSQIISGSIELPADMIATGSVSTGRIPARAEVTIPVRSFKSGKSAFDKRMMDILREESHPKLLFSLTELTCTNAIREEGRCVLLATGSLTLAGVTNQMAFPAEVRSEGAGFLLQGAFPLKMSDYGIKDRSASISGVTVTAGDDVYVTFDWYIKKRELHD